MNELWRTARLPLHATVACYLLGAVAGIVLGLMDDAPTARRPWNYSAADLLAHNLPLIALLVLGSVTFGLTSIGLLLMHGQVLGSSLVGALRLHDSTDVMLALLPHGVFELPATLLAGAGGFVLTEHAWRSVIGRPRRWRASIVAVVWLGMVAVALTVLAAPIEAHVSLHLVED